MKKLIVGNWKMNPDTLDDAKRILAKTRLVAGCLSHTEVVACPSFLYIMSGLSKSARAKGKTSAQVARNFSIGAQSVSIEEGGAHTGEVGAVMLRDIGVRYVIVGHSEQRATGDTDDMVSKRVMRVLDAGMTPVVCVGEKARDEGGAYLEALKEQIKGTLGPIAKKYSADVILAYEPVWAIGAKEAMKPEQIYEMSLFVKKVYSDIFGPDAGVKVRVLYGGSVNFRNAADIFSIGKIDGLLVGRESVNLPGFVELLKSVDAIV